MPPPEYPDETLPESQVSLEGFIKIAQSLHSQSTAIQATDEAFVRFALAGRIHQSSRVSVNSRQGVPELKTSDCSIQRDFDSVIGITRDLPFSAALAVFPLASFRDTLKTDNHLLFKHSGLPDAEVCLYHSRCKAMLMCMWLTGYPGCSFTPSHIQHGPRQGR